MANCKICTSEYLPNINQMISENADVKYIQVWCKERGFKVTQKAIKEHIAESDFVAPEVTTPANRVHLTKPQIIEALEVEDSDIERYKAKVKKRLNKFDVIELMQFLLHELRQNIKGLQTEYSNLLSTSDIDRLAELKNQKLEAQIRFQDAQASIKDIKLKKLQGKLVDRQSQSEKWAYSLVGYKAKLEALPNKLALQLSGIDSESEVKKVIDALILESTDELSNGR